MRYYTEIDVPARKDRRFSHATCDLCHQVIMKRKPRSNEYDEVEISRQQGNLDNDGVIGTEIDVDMCGSCWSTKLIPWLESQGVEITTQPVEI